MKREYKWLISETDFFVNSCVWQINFNLPAILRRTHSTSRFKVYLFLFILIMRLTWFVYCVRVTNVHVWGHVSVSVSLLNCVILLKPKDDLLAADEDSLNFVSWMLRHLLFQIPWDFQRLSCRLSFDMPKPLPHSSFNPVCHLILRFCILCICLFVKGNVGL